MLKYPGYPGVSRIILEYPGASWLCWSILEYPGLSWSILGILKYLKYPESRGGSKTVRSPGYQHI